MVLATAYEMRWKVWDDPKCSSGCGFEPPQCGKGNEDVPCCVKNANAYKQQCPSRAMVEVTPPEKRFAMWEDKHCTTGCTLNECGTEVPCCVRFPPSGATDKVLTLNLPVVAVNQYTQRTLRELTTPVVKELGYTYANSFRLMSDGSVTSTTNGLELALTPSGEPTFVARGGSCPTRTMVMEQTPSEMTWLLWDDLWNECRAGCMLSDEKCSLYRTRKLYDTREEHEDAMKKGHVAPCCVRRVPTATDGDDAAYGGSFKLHSKPRFDAFAKIFAGMYATKWDMHQLLKGNGLRLAGSPIGLQVATWDGGRATNERPAGSLEQMSTALMNFHYFLDVFPLYANDVSFDICTGRAVGAAQKRSRPKVVG